MTIHNLIDYQAAERREDHAAAFRTVEPIGLQLARQAVLADAMIERLRATLAAMECIRADPLADMLGDELEALGGLLGEMRDGAGNLRRAMA